MSNNINEVESPKVAVIGMGYVGLTLASHIANLGFEIRGVEKNSNTIETLNNCNLHLNEPGVIEAIDSHINKNWTVGNSYTFIPDVVIICVSTPIDEFGQPNLNNINDSIHMMSSFLSKETLVIIRSTVPIGTTRKIAETFLKGKTEFIAFCPERTIQGQALREIKDLPQVVGGYNNESTDAAVKFFNTIGINCKKVTSLEVSEMVKLSNNCHTDLIYSYGNEIALIAQSHNIDPMEVISAANSDYPRPNLAIPGFVGGACLSKDPYIMSASVDLNKTKALFLIPAARNLNEYMPIQVANHLVDLMVKCNMNIDKNSKIFICGIAYKGIPETDDLRGAPIYPFIDVLIKHNFTILGHDPVVAESITKEIGATPVSFEEGIREANAVVFLNNHPFYSSMDISKVLEGKNKTFIVYDCWRIFEKDIVLENNSVVYAGIGYETKNNI
ncbi:MAG: nucleotide sugar dehydrogenase [Lutibacter sp.]|nr:nucleotide sugar dehydrogenase [Lutibacter sp.]